MSTVEPDDVPAWLEPVARLVDEPGADVFPDWPHPDGAEPTPASVLILFGHDQGPDVLLL